MRVPTNAHADRMIDRISRLGCRQAALQSQVATGQRITNPQDDPSAFGRVMSLDDERRLMAQFQVNASHALDVSTASFAGIRNLKKISDRAGEIGTLGAGALSRDAFDAYASELDQLIEQAIQMANSRLRGEYLFAGTAVDAAPFSASRDANGTVLSVAYDGNADRTSIPISDTATLSPGTTGATNMGLRDFINHLIDLRTALGSGSASGVQAVQQNLLQDENLIISALSEHGAVQMRIEISREQGFERLEGIERLISGDADVDVPEAIARLSQASTAYQAALQSAAQIMQVSLLDYIR